MKIQLVLAAILFFSIPFAPAYGQPAFAGSVMYSVLNQAPASTALALTVSNAQQGTNGWGSYTLIHGSGTGVFNVLPDGIFAVADQTMAVSYGIPYRANQDADALKNTLDDKIAMEQSARTGMMNLYNSMSDVDRQSMDINGFWDLIAGYDDRINRYMQALDALYLGRLSLSFEANKPSVINAESRFIDPVHTVPLMRANEVEYGPGGHLVPKEGIPFDVLNALPSARTLTIYRK